MSENLALVSMLDVADRHDVAAYKLLENLLDVQTVLTSHVYVRLLDLLQVLSPTLQVMVISYISLMSLLSICFGVSRKLQ